MESSIKLNSEYDNFSNNKNNIKEGFSKMPNDSQENSDKKENTKNESKNNNGINNNLFSSNNSQTFFPLLFK